MSRTVRNYGPMMHQTNINTNRYRQNRNLHGRDGGLTFLEISDGIMLSTVNGKRFTKRYTSHQERHRAQKEIRTLVTEYRVDEVEAVEEIRSDDDYDYDYDYDNAGWYDYIYGVIHDNDNDFEDYDYCEYEYASLS